MGLLLLIVLILLLAGVYPGWGGPYGWHGYGWGPFSLLGAVLVVILLLAAFDVIGWHRGGWGPLP